MRRYEIYGIVYGTNWEGCTGYCEFTLWSKTKKLREIMDYSGYGFAEVEGICYYVNTYKHKNGMLQKTFGNRPYFLGNVPDEVIPKWLGAE